MQKLRDSLLDMAGFFPSSTQFPCAWAGHLPFAAWVMRALAPRVFVELGTHSGNSYFAFCQAVRDAGLPTRCHAVDTWQGDDHAGSYGDDIFDHVTAHNDTHYADFSRLLRMTFDEAAGLFDDASISMLHIDGLHTYEAVRHDYETWLPKLGPGAIVLFHDTTVREREFGVWKLWAELCAIHPHHLEFGHSHGLGVLQVGAGEARAPWLVPNSAAQNLVLDFFSGLGELHQNRCELWCRTEDLRRTEASLHDVTARLDEREHWITHLEQVIVACDARVEQVLADRDASIAEIYASHSWKCTKPLRDIGDLIRTFRAALHAPTPDEQPEDPAARLRQHLHAVQTSFQRAVPEPVRLIPIRIIKLIRITLLLPRILRKGGGLGQSYAKMRKILRNEGLLGIKARLRKFIAKPALPLITPELCADCEAKLGIVPFYIDPARDAAPSLPAGTRSIAIHVHLFYTDMLREFTSRLAAMPCAFDLFVSVPQTADCAALADSLRESLPQAAQIVVEAVPNRGRDIAPLIIQFGQRLAEYDLIAHVHSKKSPHCDGLAAWCADLLDALCGPPNNNGGRMAAIISLLAERAKLVYPEGQSQILKDRTGWSENRDLAQAILEKYTTLSIGDFPAVSFSEGTMFWARAACLRDMLLLPLTYADFPAEPIPADGTLAHALERLLLIFASTTPGQCLRLHRGDSRHDYRHYEEQRDFSSAVAHSDAKILAYYLPQFHPIPENDRWHGPGFTEWTKVRAANPLFAGHYQQHIPHPDLGYYLLDSPDTLRRQAELMRQAGVHGQVFYHYWFSGTLILEKPARMLLDNPDIAMPFCFCWANENWTRRWDGNEQDVLLSQDYSADDARAFIRYLLPFFHDPRYLRVDDRPLLFVYRPASMPDAREYIRIWAGECAAAGLNPPYVTAVLTRGATDPRDFGMDAGVERPLHDWTDKAVADIRPELQAYEPLRGSVLPYAPVARHYMAQTEPKEFPWFRSVLPMWDNTARYGGEAYLLHDATPDTFQAWLESALAYSRGHLPADRRFILVNAWNEWAEGAHLEPDSRHGYAYLNAVGRALSGRAPAADVNPEQELPAGLRVRLSLPEPMLAPLRADAVLRRRFLRCLGASTLFARAQISLDAPELAAELRGHAALAPDDAEPDFILQFRKPAFFAPTGLENMLKAAVNAPGAVILSNAYDRFAPLIEATANGSVEQWVAFNAPVLAFPVKTAPHGYKNYRVRGDAMTFVPGPSLAGSESLPQVTTIVRVHAAASLERLANALYCLAAMEDCAVSPLVAAQDLSEDQTEKLRALLAAFPAAPGARPRIMTYSSPDGRGDLRARMLTESLRAVETRYAAFLDYDDLLMSNAYSWLLGRLRQTGKAVAFGRVYSTILDSATGLFRGRTAEFTHGRDYEEFLCVNHAPLHSFMLDLSQLETKNLVFHDDQRYLEDYYLTLQLFSQDNADWASLGEDMFIGEYLHGTEQANTLALVDEEGRLAIRATPEYQQCEERVRILRERCVAARK